MKSVQIHDCSCTERREKEDSSLYGGCKLFLSEDGLEVVRVDCGIASIPPFRIDILSSSKSIQFGAKMTRVEPDDKIELGEMLSYASPLIWKLHHHGSVTSKTYKPVFYDSHLSHNTSYGGAAII